MGLARSPLRMRFDEDMTEAEIGEIIGVSQMQISRLIGQALQCLREGADQEQPALAQAA